MSDKTYCRDAVAYIAKLEMEIAELRKDAERMNWLEKNGGLIGIQHVGHGDYRFYAGEAFSPIREAIDRARIAS